MQSDFEIILPSLRLIGSKRKLNQSYYLSLDMERYSHAFSKTIITKLAKQNGAGSELHHIFLIYRPENNSLKSTSPGYFRSFTSHYQV